jgi:hypothetical protein
MKEEFKKLILTTQYPVYRFKYECDSKINNFDAIQMKKVGSNIKIFDDSNLKIIINRNGKIKIKLTGLNNEELENRGKTNWPIKPIDTPTFNFIIGQIQYLLNLNNITINESVLDFSIGLSSIKSPLPNSQYFAFKMYGDSSNVRSDYMKYNDKCYLEILKNKSPSYGDFDLCYIIDILENQKVKTIKGFGIEYNHNFNEPEIKDLRKLIWFLQELLKYFSYYHTHKMENQTFEQTMYLLFFGLIAQFMNGKFVPFDEWPK